MIVREHDDIILAIGRLIVEQDKEAYEKLRSVIRYPLTIDQLIERALKEIQNAESQRDQKSP